MLLAKIGTGALAEMSVQQLKDSNAYADELINAKSKTSTANTANAADAASKALGFDTAAEQKQLAQTLYGLLVKPEGLDLNKDQASQFLKDRKFERSTTIPKDVMIGLIKEANALIEAKKQAEQYV